MSRYRKQRFVVAIEQPLIDGCGNEIKPITEGMVRKAIENIDSVCSVNVNEPIKTVWMVTWYGSLSSWQDGVAESYLFSSRVSALKFVKKELKHLIYGVASLPHDFTDEEFEKAKESHTKWFDEDNVCFFDGDTRVTYDIREIDLPKTA